MNIDIIKNNRKSPLVISIIILLFVLVVGGIGSVGWYAVQLRPTSSSQNAKLFVIHKGETLPEIAQNLKKAGLIKNAWAFETYVKAKGLGSKFQAGTYALSPSQDVKEVVTALTKGKVTSVLVTILPGKRVDQIRAELINVGFSPDEVDTALDPANYSNLPILSIKPSQVITLEGLLWPDSFQKDQTTEVSDIIRQSLIEMDEKLTPELRAAFAAHGLSPYQGLVLASMLEQEVSNPNDLAQASQVFHTRLKKNMPLGSDPTAKYGAILAGLEPSLTYDSPYNTLLYAGLPPTPISTINKDALNAAANPANTNWLYFVAGDDGKTHFSSTMEQHQALTAKYCTKLCGN